MLSIIPHESHGSVALISEYDALHFLFRKIPIEMELPMLKQFEGRHRHQFQEGEDSFLDIVAKENILLIKESWSDYPMKFSPISSRAFYSFHNKFPVTFNKNGEGEIFELVAFCHDVWEEIE